MSLRSLLDLDLPPLVEAERLLGELSRRRTLLLAGAGGLTVGAAFALWRLQRVWAVAAVAAAIAALALSFLALDRRRALLAGLVQVRDAYRLEEVSRAGSRFATRAPP